jgi:hypothetical protein
MPLLMGDFQSGPRKRQSGGVVEGGLADLPLPEPGFIRLRAVGHDDIGLVAELDGPVTVPSGYGSFEVVPRPRRVGITTYTGRAPLTLRIPIRFDRWTEQKSIEAEIKTLETMLGIHALSRPPQLVVEGFGVPHSYSRDASLRWTLNGDPEWGEDVRFRPVGGHRCFAQVVISALQVSTPSAVEEIATASSGRAARKTYTVGSLRTLRAIGKHYKVDWQKLRKLNAKLTADPDKTLRAGTKVRVK